MTGLNRRRDEGGAVLLLAIIFVVIISLVLVALVSLAGNDLKNTSNLISQQTIEYSATGAANIALENVENSDPTLPTFQQGTPAKCLPNVPTVGGTAEASVTPLTGGATPAPSIWVTCAYGANTIFGPFHIPGSTAYGAYTRQLYIFACQSSSPTCGGSGSKPVVTATVEIVDGSSCSASAVATCGQQAVVEGWQNSAV